MQEKNKYNYLVLGAGGEYYDYAYRDVNKLNYAKFVNSRPWGNLCNKLYSIHISKKVNSVMQLPFKKVWVKFAVNKIQKYVREMEDCNRPVCFVLFAGGVNTDLLQYNLCNELRKTFINSKIVYFCQDLIDATHKPIEEMKRNADMVISYDRGDAEKYGLFYYNIPYSDVTDLFDIDIEKQSDVCFVGAAKNRYEDILAVYEKLTKEGLICDFNIIGVPKENRHYETEINYLDYIPYKQNIEKIIRSRCILEIKQKGSVGNTIRVDEAIIFNKFLLTDNTEIKNNMWYNSENMSVFEKADKIDICFIQKELADYSKERRNMNPVYFLDFIDENI